MDDRRDESPQSTVIEEFVLNSEENHVEEDHRSFDGPAHTPARSLLVHFGRWKGEDVKALLEMVHRTRGNSRF